MAINQDHVKKLLIQHRYEQAAQDEKWVLYFTQMMNNPKTIDVKLANAEQLCDLAIGCELGLLKGDIKQAVIYWNMSAEKGFVYAMTALGFYYREHCHDQKQAKTWFEQAAHGGSTSAMCALGNILLNEEKWTEGFFWIQKSGHDLNQNTNLTQSNRENLIKMIMAFAAESYHLKQLNEKLETQNKELHEENIHLRYRPGPGFVQAKENFEQNQQSLAKKDPPTKK